eukprot:12980553-Alexandrium_andersonii.AAC.1
MHRRSSEGDASALFRRRCIGTHQAAILRRSSSNRHATFAKRSLSSGNKSARSSSGDASAPVSYTHLRAHETSAHL